MGCTWVWSLSSGFEKFVHSFKNHPGRISAPLGIFTEFLPHPNHSNSKSLDGSILIEKLTQLTRNLPPKWRHYYRYCFPSNIWNFWISVNFIPAVTVSITFNPHAFSLTACFFFTIVWFKLFIFSVSCGRSDAPNREVYNTFCVYSVFVAISMLSGLLFSSWVRVNHMMSLQGTVIIFGAK